MIAATMQNPNNFEDMLRRNIARNLDQGLGQQERQNYWDNAVAQLNKQRDEGTQAALRAQNRRGLLDSSFTGDALNKISDTYSQNLTGLQRDLYNLDAQRRNQNLGMGLNYLTGISMPREQMGWQAEQNQLGRDWQSSENLLGRDWQSEQNQLGRDWQGGQNELNRQLQRWLQENQARMEDKAGKGGLLGDIIGGLGSIFASPVTGGASLLSKILGF